MPTYEYRCPRGHHFDLVQKMSDVPGAICPECGEESERLLSGGAGFLFKGDGFYITDHRSESYKKEASNEAKPESSSSDSDSPSKKPKKKKKDAKDSKAPSTSKKTSSNGS